MGRSIRIGASSALCALAVMACPAALRAAPPTVELLVAPATGDSAHYARVISWRGTDPEGSGLSYRYAIDQQSNPFPYWVPTDGTSQLYFFSARDLVLPLPASGPPLFATSHHFAVKAVDGEALESAPAEVSFHATTWGPEVRLTSPVPNPTAPVVFLTSGFTLNWSGVDWDGLFSNRPVKFKYRMWTQQAFDYPQYPNFIDFVRGNPDQFRQLVAPAFVNWDSCSGDTTSATYTNFTPGKDYLFTLTAIDEAGAYAARFGNATNLLWFRISSSVAVGSESHPARLSLAAPAPNPARSSVSLSLEMPAASETRIDVVDVGGRQIRSLYEGPLAAGRHPVTWDLADGGGRRVAAGVYFVRAVTLDGAVVRRTAVVK